MQNEEYFELVIADFMEEFIPILLSLFIETPLFAYMKYWCTQIDLMSKHAIPPNKMTKTCSERKQF